MRTRTTDIRRLAITIALALFLSGCHPWFKMGPGAPADQKPEITTPNGKYLPGTPSWVPLIDACMEAGGTRNDCIAALPEEELKKLEAWEQRNAWRRQRLLRERNEVFGAEKYAPGG